jgi:1,4-alpha-glucan branching enzyme
VSTFVHQDDKVMVYKKGEVIFAFNFHPTKSFPGYFLPVSRPGEYRVLLSTDEARFGGAERADITCRYRTVRDANGRLGFYCYLPSRCALVLERVNIEK